MEIYNSTSNTIVDGSSGDDYIENYGDGVTIFAYSGNDTISGEYRGVTLDAGIGNDFIDIINTRSNNGVYDNSNVKGGEGNDTIITEEKYIFGSTISGDAGNDFIDVGIEGYVSIDGGDGNDSINVTVHYYSGNTINGGDGADFISIAGGYSSTKISGGDGNDIINIGVSGNTIYGDAGNDFIVIESDATENTVIGGDGNDTVSLAGMSNVVYYEDGAGNDVIFGFNASDSLQVAEGRLVSAGTVGDDVVICTGDKNFLTVKNGAERTFNIQFSKGQGRSVSTVIANPLLEMNGTNSADSLHNVIDSVTIAAGAGNDTVTNVGDKVSIDAGAGNDFISSSGKNVTIIGGAGNDNVSLSGSAIYQYSGGKDTISGASTSDTIHIANGNISNATVSGTNVILTVGGDSITLKDARDKSLKIKIGNANAFSTVLSAEIPAGISLKGATLTANTAYGGSSIDLADYEGVTKINASALKKSVQLIGNAAANSLKGGKNADTIFGGSGNDTILGGTGNDALYGDAGNDKISGEAGNDTIYSGAGNDTLTGGAGNDVFVYEGGNNLITDYKSGEDKIKIVSGSITGASLSGSNVIFKIGSGSVTVKGGKNKNITVIDSKGNETTNVYPLDTLPTGLTYDATKKKLTVGTGFKNTAIDLADYAKTLKTVDASKFTKKISITGNNLGDTILSGKGNDTLSGGSKADSISGGAGNDKISGAAGNDTLTGGAGNDSISGDAGNDKISGDAGNDTLIGAAGNDTLTGGAGKDVFVYSAGKDVITDYTAGQDKIKIASGSIKKTAYSGKNVIFTIGSGTLTVQNGKGKKITIVDAKNKTTTETYGAVSGSSKLWSDDNFIGAENNLDAITEKKYSVSNLSAPETENLAQSESFITYAEK